MSIQQIDTLLNKQSGLLGLSGLTSDMRELLEEEEENQDRRAILAIDIFCSRARRYIGAYFAELGGTSAVLFTGGIGENSALIRERICKGLSCIGLRLDKRKNYAAKPGEEKQIATRESKIKVWVIPTNEELLIARDTVRVIENAPRRW
jgi:acetate kinase